MLAIRVNDDCLDLPADVAVTLKFSSPLFNAVGNYSYPFSIPSTPLNRRILSFGHRTENPSARGAEYTADLYWNKTMLLRSTLRVTGATDARYEIELYVERGNFNWETRDAILSELDLGYMLFADIDHFIAWANEASRSLYGPFPVAFPRIKNLSFFDPPATDPELQYVNNRNVNHNLYYETAQQNRSVITPFVYLKWLLDRVAEKFGYRIGDRFFTGQMELTNLVLYNSFQNNYEYGNGYEEGMFYKNLLPRTKVPDFIAGLENYFNCVFLVESRSGAIRIFSREEILLRAESFPLTRNILGISLQKEEIPSNVSFSMSLDSGDALMEYFSSFDESFRSSVRGFVNRYADLLAPPLCHLVRHGDVYFSKEDGKFYCYSVSQGSGTWIVYNIPPTYGQCFLKFPLWESLEYSTPFSFLKDDMTEVSCGNKNLENDRITPRLFFLEKILPVHTARSINDNLCMYWGSEHGIVLKFWERWIRWILSDRRLVRITAQLDFGELAAVDFSRKYRINGSNYLLSEIQVTLKKNAILPATIKAYSCC